MSSTSVSKWLVECIKMAGPEAIFTDKVRSHDTRALSTPWALFNGTSVTHIIKAAYRSNSNTFVAMATSGPPGVSSSAQLFLDYFYDVVILILLLPSTLSYLCLCYSALCNEIRKVRQLARYIRFVSSDKLIYEIIVLPFIFPPFLPPSFLGWVFFSCYRGNIVATP